MGHCIAGIVSDIARLRRFSFEFGLHSPAPLSGHLGFLPLEDDLLDRLFPEQGSFDGEMTHVSSALKAALAILSEDGTVAFIETQYHGGTGTQGATVYHDGVCIMEPSEDRSGPISRALGLLGVEIGKGATDEFEAAGLNRCRNNEDWINMAESTRR